MIKMAMVGIVRDEATDILSWIGWHVRLGVDCFVLFDDGSIDGTLELLKDASSLHDIRLYQIENRTSTHPDRQKIVYLDTIRALGNEFDWLGFLDTDEYLALHRHDTLTAFLSEFGPDIGAVGINWCNYGSSGHVTKPDMPVFHAFTHHYPPSDPINGHVKTFLRPEHWDGTWLNPHYFGVKDKRYVSPKGEDIRWSPIRGITAAEPDWDTARIMHYQLRSMEHFVERTRRRRDLPLVASDFARSDHGVISDTRPRGLTTSVLNWTRQSVRQGVARVLDALPLPEEEHAAEGKNGAFPAEIIVHKLIPWNGMPLEVHSGLAFARPRGENSSQVLALQISALPGRLYLFAADSAGRLLDWRINDDSRLLTLFSYETAPTGEQGRFGLRLNGGLSRNRTYLTAIADEPLAADRRLLDEWETFRLQKQDYTPGGEAWQDHPLVLFAERAFSRRPALASLALMAREDRYLTIMLLPALFAALAPAEQTTLRNALGPLGVFTL